MVDKPEHVSDIADLSQHPAIMAAYLYISGKEPRALSVDQVGAALLRPVGPLRRGLPRVRASGRSHRTVVN